MILTPEEIVEKLRDNFKENIHNARIVKKEDGYKNVKTQNIIWVTLGRSVFHRAVSMLHTIHPLHIACPMSSRELNDGLELIYTFTLFSGTGNFQELVINLVIFLPENDLRIRSVTDIVPGILYMERETMEMLGVNIEDIPDSRRLFTPDTIAKDFYPMRTKFNS
jgi:membrane-bound hydrogenase subunit beta